MDFRFFGSFRSLSLFSLKFYVKAGFTPVKSKEREMAKLSGAYSFYVK